MTNEAEQQQNYEEQSNDTPDPHAQQLSGDLEQMKNWLSAEQQHKGKAWESYAG